MAEEDLGSFQAELFADVGRVIVSKLTAKELKFCLQAFRTLTTAETKRHSKYLRSLLKLWFNKHYASQDGVIADHLRRAICWCDEALYLPECKSQTE